MNRRLVTTSIRMLRSSMAGCLAVCLFALGSLAAAADISLIPRPLKLETKPDTFRLTADTRILVDPESRATGEYLADLLASSTSLRLPVVDDSGSLPVSNAIVLRISADFALGDEGYHFDVTPSAVHITAKTSAGAFYGVQTLRQLLPPAIESSSKTGPGEWAIPCLHIEDQPRFRWRGLMLDVGRHFFTVEDIQRLLDLMAVHKFNRCHWHLTDDQGWRIELKKYPKLTQVGAWRDAGNGAKYGGFYTQEQIRNVVAYAAARHITVVPEIEMPGHCQAALAAYPQLSCTGGPFTVGTRWGVYGDVYCAGKEQTFEFLQDVLREVIDLFPGDFIHIGGDECPKERWKACPDCQARIHAEGLKDEHELQSYFIKRIDAFVTSKGRRIIGWDEILEGGLAPGAAVMSWHGTTGAVAAAQANHQVVLSPTSHCYFDYYQSRSPAQPKAIGGYLPIEKVYDFNPLPTGLPQAREACVLGGQANLWTEYIDTQRQLDYMTFPRACALAEVLWSQADDRSWEEFSHRLEVHLRRLDALNVQYCKEPLPTLKHPE